MYSDSGTPSPAEATPTAPPPAPAPVVPAPPPTSTPAPAPASPAKPKRRLTHTQQFGLVAGVLVLLAFAALVNIVVQSNNINGWEVLAASNSAGELSSDVSAAIVSLTTMESATNVADLTTANAALANDISDAQKQYNIVNTSPVLRDETVKQKFTPVKDKWIAYVNFVQGTSTDYKTFGPLLVQLDNSQQSALSESHQTNANIATELVQYQALLNSVSHQAAGLKLQTTPDQQLLADLESYIKNSNTSIVQAQSDVSGNKGVNAITADITNLAGAATVFSNDQDTLTTSASATLQHDDPTAQISGFITALGGLSNRINQ